MDKLITTIVGYGKIHFDEINSFETENYIGIWNYEKWQFMLIRKSDIQFHPKFLKECYDLKELDDEVMDKINEHIKEIYDTSYYKIELVSKQSK